MSDFAVISDWMSYLVRWAHVAAAMAWFGAAFYFHARGSRLRPAADLPAGAVGSDWQFHGGGFVRSVKYAVAPPGLPDRLAMFKWESYFTWITGALLLALVYHAQARLFLIDEHKLALSPAAAIAISALSLVGGWLLYDRLCAAMVARPAPWLDAPLFGLTLLASWGYDRIFADRAAPLHLGALLATIMVGNVFFVVIPNGARAMAARRAGREPEPADRLRTAQRGRHTRHLHLPILFLMLAAHFPLAYATEFAWLLPAPVLAIGALIGRAFDTYYREGRMPAWPWAGSAILVIPMMWLTAAPRPGAAHPDASADFAAVAEVIATRCAMCHADEPAWDGIHQPPGHLLLGEPDVIVANARRIHLWAGLSDAMPPGNVSGMTAGERALISGWYGAGAPGGDASGRD